MLFCYYLTAIDAKAKKPSKWEVKYAFQTFSHSSICLFTN